MQQRDHNEYVKLRDFFANLFLPFFLRTHHLRLRSFSFLLAQPRNGRKTRNQKEKKKKERNKRKRADVIKRGNENQEKKRGKVKNGRDDVALE